MSKALRVIDRVVAVVVPIVVVVVLATFATIGHLARSAADGEAVLLSQQLTDQPGRVVGTWLLAAAGYAALLGLLIVLYRRAGPREATGRITRASEWVFARWWRVSLVLMVLWSPLFVMQAPGSANSDLHFQVMEVLKDRGDDFYKPFDVYPMAHYLLPNDQVLLSNHHNAFLTWIYGRTIGLSGTLFGSYKPGFLLLTSTQAVFTLVALGRAMSVAASWVLSSRVKVVALVVLVACGYPMALWSTSIAKNPLFAAAFVWWLALSVEHARSTGRPPRWRWLEWLVVTLVMLISAKFALYIVAVQIVVLVIVRRGWPAWRSVGFSLVLPTMVFYLALKSVVAAGWVIPGDPLAGNGLQIQTTAVVLKEHPDALSPSDRDRLEEIFDVDMMVDVYDPATMKPIRGAGYSDGAYKWREVTREEAAQFPDIWWDLVRSEPRTVADGVLFKAYAFFDPLTQGRFNWPNIRINDLMQSKKINGLVLTDDGTNDALRTRLHDATVTVNETSGLSLVIASSVRVVLVILLVTAGIALRRPSVWVWGLPLALHSAVLVMSPLSSSGRYALGIAYALPFAVLAVAASRREESSSTEPTG